jgi:hypothetical protein
MLHALSFVVGFVVGVVIWIECAVVIGSAFLICPIRPLLAAIALSMAFAFMFRDLVGKYPVPAVVFFIAIAAPFVVHIVFAL